MHWSDIAAIIACLIGGGLGGYGMINPSWVSDLVRVVPAPGKVEGKSEFRATYGGLFLGGHMFALWTLLSQMPGAELASGALGAGWCGSGAGRLVSFMVDKTASRLNVFNVCFEFVLGVALLLPLILVAA